MFKKWLVGIATVFFIIGSSQIALAKELWASKPLGKPASTTVKSNALLHLDQYRYFFIDLTGGAYYLNNLVFDIGTKEHTTVPLGKITDNGFTPIYKIDFGYHFVRCDKDWLSMLFGNENTVLLKTSYVNASDTKRKADLGKGTIWYIDGTGAIWGDLYNEPIIKDLYNFKLRAQHRLIDTGLYFKGHHYTTNEKLTIDPLVGLIYTNLQEKYNYTLNYDTGEIQHKVTDHERYDISTHFYGVAIGNQLNYEFVPQLFAFANAEIQLLYASANLDAHQDASTEEVDHKHVRDTDNKITYRGILTLGLEYHLTNQPNSPAVILKGGIDRWGYEPQVVMPNNETSPAAHLYGQGRHNTFVMLEVHIPFA